MKRKVFLFILCAVLTASLFSTSAFAGESGSAVKAASVSTAKTVKPAITLSKKAFTWNGKAKTPAVTVKVGSKTLKKGTDYTVQYKNNVNVGTASAVVTLKGKYKGTGTASFKISPKGTSLLGLKKTETKLTVKWEKQSAKMSKGRITGYQVQIARDKSFTKNKKTVTIEGYTKTTKTFSGLKPYTKYFARVRTYKVIKDKKYYSAWSEVRSKKDTKPEPRPYPYEYGNFVYHENDFKLADMLYESIERKNTIISPMSINMALAMVLEGASGDSRTELENFLGVWKEDLPGYVENLFGSAFENGELTTTINNAFWYQNGQPVNPDYTDKLASAYRAVIAGLDFSDPAAAADEINAWCKETTKGLIPSIVDENTLKGMSDVFLNTVYFNNHWLCKVEKDKVEDGWFHGFDGDVPVTYLHTDERVVYENDKAIAFEKRYKENYYFVGILPKENGEFTLEDLDIQSLMQNRIMDYDDVYVTMPKFNLESGGEITDILRSLGVQTAFTPEADFSEIAPDIMLSRVLHKTKMILDENGTEAAAATAVTAEASAYPGERKTIKIELTRPYAFMIVDGVTGNVLFAGKITNPASNN